MVDRSISSRGARRAAGLPVTLPALALLAAGALAPAGCVSKARYTQVEQNPVEQLLVAGVRVDRHRKRMVR